MTPTELLFGKFPRTVASSAGDMPNQTHVFSQGEFDVFVDKVRENKNVYSSISKFPVGGQPIVDKIPFDFDSPTKKTEFPPTFNDCEKIERMRDDSWLATTVLGDVLEDAKTLARYTERRDIPSIAVFSGLGMHYYLLTRTEEEDEERTVKDKMKSTNAKLTEELGLETSDTVVAQPERILRVPNCRRVSEVDGEAVPCDVWTVPILPHHLIDMSVENLLETAKEPNVIDLDEEEYSEENRPVMQVHEDYMNISRGPIQAEELGDIDEVSDDEVDFILNEMIEMPCISERVKQRNPGHNTRFVFAVQLFNIGYTVEEIVEIIRKLNWVDFDADKTRKFLKQIYEHGYGRWSCRTMMDKGLCVHSDNPSDCPTFMESGEHCKW